MLELDLVLAILHHLFVFALFGVLSAELVSVRPGMDAAAASRIARIDNWYGVLAAVIVIAGLCRAVFAAKGWEYYSHNAFFWAKIAAFVVIALLSIPPTVAFIGWRRNNASPKDRDIAKVRRYLLAEVVLFPLLPAFAAAMARGYGGFWD